jgi:methionine-rich copper-binding protein CopC
MIEGMLQMRRRIVLLGLALTFCLPGLAQAHAILVGSTPAIGATVAPGPVALQLRYNSRIDRARSLLTLIRPDHSTSVIPIAAEGRENMLLATVTLSPGRYIIRWQVLAIDGHITRGDVPLTVKAGH